MLNEFLQTYLSESIVHQLVSASSAECSEFDLEQNAQSLQQEAHTLPSQGYSDPQLAALQNRGHGYPRAPVLVAAMQLEAGCWYWFRQVFERIWRICYVSQDSDDNLWLWWPGTETTPVGQIDQTMFEFRLIPEPVD